MIYDLSHRPKKVLDEIDSRVGPAFNLLEKVRMNGSGSPKLLIKACSDDIAQKIVDTADLKFMNVELRAGGILIHIHTQLKVYAHVIAYHHLSIYQNGTLWSFHGQGSYIKASCMSSDVSLRNYMLKLMKLKSAHCGDSIDHGTGS